jgi:polyisoprenoid-binding protein YceI
LKGSAVNITIPVSSLVIDSMEGRRRAGLSSGPSADDIRKIQQKMLGPEVLDAARYPNLEFVSTFVQENRTGELQLTGQFRMHGQAREVRFPLRYQRNGEGRVDFSGQFTIKQTDFGIQPESIGLGAVKVKDEVQIRFQVSMAPAP